MLARDRLAAAGLSYSQADRGRRLVICAARDTIDFWPSSGLWIKRGSSRRRYGVRALIKEYSQ